MKDIREQLAVVGSMIRSSSGGDDELVRAFDALCKQLARRGLDHSAEVTTPASRVSKVARHVHKLESLGRLTAGVSHEINNPLNYLLGNLSLARAKIDELAGQIDAASTVELAELLGDAVDGADRIRRIVAEIMNFARTEEGEIGAADVGPSVHTAIKLVGSLIRHRARLVTDLDDLPAVCADRLRLEQVFLNLLLNAAHAFTENADTNEIKITASRQLGDVVVVEIEDNGCGMSAEVAEHIFEPFFTTKAVGEGTGLGLFVCHGIIASFGGRISIASEAGVGTTVRVILPVAAPLPEDQTPIPEIVAGTRPFDGHNLRVLVVDDEPRVASVLGRMIGSNTDVVGDGAAALELHKAQAYDVVLCDLMMPDMSGIEFYRAMARLGPGHKERIVFLTGGAFTPAAEKFLEEVPNTCLEKPVSAGELRRVIEAQGVATRSKA